MLILKILLVSLGTFLINVPCGFWREGVKKFSPYWFVAVHLPIPLVVLMRIKSEIGFLWYTYPLVVAAYFGGQFIGARIRKARSLK